MNSLTIIDAATGAVETKGSGWFEDPLDADLRSDATLEATRRGLTRVALIAAETGARFQREGVDGVDPMAWLLAPRRLFGGRAAIEACLEREHFMRGLLLHGLSLGMDADPAEIDDLLAEAGDDGAGEADGAWAPSRAAPRARERGEGLRLFTATIAVTDDSGSVQAFHASLAKEPSEVASRVARRFGTASVDARIVAGFDRSDPLVAALVSEVLCDTLALIADAPGSPLAAGLDLTIEQRFTG